MMLPDGVEIIARQTEAEGADYEGSYLVARVSADAKQVSINHPCDAKWPEVMAAHIALRDYINERIERQEACPFRPSRGLTPPSPGPISQG